MEEEERKRMAEPRKRGRWTWFFAGFSCSTLVLVLWVSVLVGVAARRLSSDVAVSSPVRETILVEGGPDKLAVISLRGVLIQPEATEPWEVDPIQEMIRHLGAAEEDPAVKGVLLEIDSPGGGIAESDLLHDRVWRLREAKPVVAHLGGVAASGGYYIAAATDRIVASPTTLTGSIGVIGSFPNVRGLADKIGLEMQIVKSGRMKDAGSPFREMTPEERALWQGLIDEMYERFLEVILATRDGSPIAAAGKGEAEETLDATRLREIADGRVYTARQAEALGLVDGIAHRHGALEILREKAKVENPTVVAYGRPGLIESLLSLRPSLLARARADWRERFGLRGPGLYYLWLGH